jgi:hypothetical protein
MTKMQSSIGNAVDRSWDTPQQQPPMQPQHVNELLREKKPTVAEQNKVTSTYKPVMCLSARLVKTFNSADDATIPVSMRRELESERRAMDMVRKSFYNDPNPHSPDHRPEGATMSSDDACSALAEIERRLKAIETRLTITFPPDRKNAEAKAKEVNEYFGTYSRFKTPPPLESMFSDLDTLEKGLSRADRKADGSGNLVLTGIVEAEREVLLFISQATIGTDGWKARQKDRASMFGDAAAKDVDVGNAYKNWSKSSTQDKLSACKKLAQHMATALGLPKAPEVLPLPPEDMSPSLMAQLKLNTRLGLYDHASGNLKVNLDEASEFEEIIDTITHEVTHAWQHMLAEQNLSNIAPEDRDAARAFAANFKDGRYSDGEEAVFFATNYANQPVEMDAFYMGEIAAKSLISRLG